MVLFRELLTGRLLKSLSSIVHQLPPIQYTRSSRFGIVERKFDPSPMFQKRHEGTSMNCQLALAFHLDRILLTEFSSTSESSRVTKYSCHFQEHWCRRPDGKNFQILHARCLSQFGDRSMFGIA